MVRFPACSLFFWCAVFFTACSLARCSFTTEYLYDLINPVLYCCSTYSIPSIFIHRVVLPLLLLLCVLPYSAVTVVAAVAAAVRHRVPDGKHCCWFIGSGQVAFVPRALYIECCCCRCCCCLLYTSPSPRD